MRLVLILVTVMSVNNVFAECSINLGAKTESSKNAKLNGISFSSKQLDALKSVCNVNIKLMSDEELVEDFKDSLAKKRAKALKE